MKQEDWDRHYAEREPPASAEPHLRLEEEAAGLRPGRALDLACGSGRNAVWLAARGFEVTAVDFSEVAIAAGRELAANAGVEVNWVVADLLSYRPEPRSYDLVALMFCHLPPPERDAVLELAAEAVAPEGTFVLAAHDRENLEEGYRGPRDPEVLYTPADVVRRFDGFEIAKAETVRRPIATPEGEGVMVDAVVVARRPRGDGELGG